MLGIYQNKQMSRRRRINKTPNHYIGNDLNDWWAVAGGIILILAINFSVSLLVGIYCGSNIIKPILKMLSLIPKQDTQIGYIREWYITLAGFSCLWIYQTFYAIPIIYWCYKTARGGTLKGVIMGAIFSALVTLSCFVSYIKFAISQ
jgi:hypothetical protein